MLLSLFSSFAAVMLLVIPLTSTYADEKKVELLPEPLTLDIALNLIDQQHPDLRYINADLQSSRSNLQQVLSTNDLNINLKATARWIAPPDISVNQTKEDHRVGLFVNKTLHDFGRSASQVDAATQQVVSQNFQYLNARQHQHIVVMQRYFEVVLADLQFYRYNEEMAVAFIQFDRMQVRHKLGQHSEVEVAEKEAEYNRMRRLRTYSQNQQRVTRALLAQALNRPNNLPATVAKPEVDISPRKLPDVEKTQKTVRKNNPALKSLRAKLIAAKNNIQFAQAGDNPILTGGIETFAYNREISSSDKWRAQITLDIPLWSGSRVDAAVAKAKSEVYKIEAELAQKELLLEQQVLEILLGLETLKAKYDEVLSAMNFTELSLDESRALYELEVKSDLGLSMVKFSEAERNVVKTSFDIALAWAQLDALSGTLLNKTEKQ